MALVEAEADGVLFRGQKKQTGTNAPPTSGAGDDDNKPKGAAKIYASLVDWPGETQSKDPNDPDVSVNPKLNFIVKKVRNYCKKNLNENGGMTSTFEDDFPGGGTALRGL